jgi:hypothetical protein
MKFDPQKHPPAGYDYSSVGAYFVTIVAWQRNYGASPELVEGNTSSVPNANGTISIVTSNPTQPCGRRMMKTRIV